MVWIGIGPATARSSFPLSVFKKGSLIWRLGLMVWCQGKSYQAEPPSGVHQRTLTCHLGEKEQPEPKPNDETQGFKVRNHACDRGD